MQQLFVSYKSSKSLSRPSPGSGLGKGEGGIRRRRFLVEKYKSVRPAGRLRVIESQRKTPVCAGRVSHRAILASVQQAGSGTEHGPGLPRAALSAVVPFFTYGDHPPAAGDRSLRSLRSLRLHRERLENTPEALLSHAPTPGGGSGITAGEQHPHVQRGLHSSLWGRWGLDSCPGVWGPGLGRRLAHAPGILEPWYPTLWTEIDKARMKQTAKRS